MRTAERNEQGFTLLEMLMTTLLTTVVLAVALPLSLRFLGFQNLLFTRQTLLCNFRLAQSGAQASGVYWNVRLANYYPEYWLFQSVRQVNYITFRPQVNYKLGYLQLQSNNIIFDVSGNAQVAGAIQLTTNQDEADIHLYMGTGLIAASGGGL